MLSSDMIGSNSGSGQPSQFNMSNNQPSLRNNSYDIESYNGSSSQAGSANVNLINNNHNNNGNGGNLINNTSIVGVNSGFNRGSGNNNLNNIRGTNSTYTNPRYRNT